MRHAYANSFFQDCPDQNIDAMWAAYADSCRIEELESENAKLRELIKDLKVAPCCGERCWMKLSDRMHELGIEVG